MDSEHAEIFWPGRRGFHHVYLLLQVNHQYNKAPFQVSLQVEINELPVHVIIPQLLEYYNIWRQLHEHWPTRANTRRWLV